MTAQYSPQTINAIAPTVALAPTSTTSTLEVSDGMVVIDTTNAGGDFTAVLPRASTVSGGTIVLVATVGNVNSVAPAVQAGDILVAAAAATLPLALANSVAILKSDGNLTWYVLSTIA